MEMVQVGALSGDGSAASGDVDGSARPGSGVGGWLGDGDGSGVAEGAGVSTLGLLAGAGDGTAEKAGAALFSAPAECPGAEALPPHKRMAARAARIAAKSRSFRLFSLHHISRHPPYSS